MANILDYLDWRGDLSFTNDPFNEVDNLILAELAYIPFAGIAPDFNEDKTISLKDASSKIKGINPQSLDKYNDPFPLLEKAGNTNRFKDIQLGRYINLHDKKDVLQFSALTYYLNDFIYISYRGTDSSMIGWKEDFYLSYRETLGQERAGEYFNNIADKTNLPVIIGGHSKGGNLAMYAATCANDKDQIIKIYSNDSPGFKKEFVASKNFQSISNKIISFIPESSVVGILMDSVPDHIILKSSSNGIGQHNPYSWEILANHFIRTDKQSAYSLFFDETIKDWLAQTDDVERADFVEMLFNAFDHMHIKDFNEVLNGGLKIAAGIAREISVLPSDKQKEMLNIIQKLASSGSGALWKETKTYLDKIPFLKRG